MGQLRERRLFTLSMLLILLSSFVDARRRAKTSAIENPFEGSGHLDVWYRPYQSRGRFKSMGCLDSVGLWLKDKSNCPIIESLRTGVFWHYFEIKI